MRAKECIHAALEEGIALRRASVGLTPQIERAAQVMVESLERGGKLLICGNGGSAADAQHFAGELVGKFQRMRRGLPAIALTANSSTLTAIGNDFAYDFVFARQVEAFCLSGDVVFGISTSGESSNVLLALEEAKKRGGRRLALTGEAPNPIANEAELAIAIPSKNTQRIQEIHIAIIHILCELIEQELFGELGKKKSSSFG